MEAAGTSGVHTDGDLARRVSAGGPDAAEAEEELCRRLAPRVRLYGLRHLRDAAAADDLVQEVLVVMLERLRAGEVREPERLGSFVLGMGEQEQLEEHLFECPHCERRGRDVLGIAHGVRGLVRRGELPASLLPEVVARLEREGRRVRDYRVLPGASVQCTVGPDDDVVLSRFGADLRGVSRVDLLIRVGDAPEQRLEDLAFDPAANELIFAPSAEWLRGLPAHVQRARLLAVGPEGEKVLGEYTFHHTPWSGSAP